MRARGGRGGEGVVRISQSEQAGAEDPPTEGGAGRAGVWPPHGAARGAGERAALGARAVLGRAQRLG